MTETLGRKINKRWLENRNDNTVNAWALRTIHNIEVNWSIEKWNNQTKSICSEIFHFQKVKRSHLLTGKLIASIPFKHNANSALLQITCKTLQYAFVLPEARSWLDNFSFTRRNSDFYRFTFIPRVFFLICLIRAHTR